MRVGDEVLTEGGVWAKVERAEPENDLYWLSSGAVVSAAVIVKIVTDTANDPKSAT